jgi:hypothetical protein
MPGPGEFSAERAWQHLEALVGIGPRVAGTEGVKQARGYILDELSKLDIEVKTVPSDPRLLPEEQRDLELADLVGVIPGDSEDVVILGAPYDSRAFEDFRFVGANDGASGAAVLLEIARVLVERPLPYTTWVAFFDGEAPRLGSDPQRPAAALLGSRMFALLLRQHQLNSRIRLVVVFNRVGDADLRIARDLRSNREAREFFFRAAAQMGRADAFPRDQGFESLIASHYFFASIGLRAVGLSDTSFGGDEPPGLYADSEDDDLEHCAPESLETVGWVALEGLQAITESFAKVDRFVDSPPGEPVQVPTALPEPEEADSPPEEGDAASPEPAAGEEAEAAQEALEGLEVAPEGAAPQVPVEPQR